MVRCFQGEGRSLKKAQSMGSERISGGVQRMLFNFLGTATRRLRKLPELVHTPKINVQPI